MSHLNSFEKIVAALAADVASGYSMSGGEDTFRTWDAMLVMMLSLWIAADPITRAILEPMTEAQRW